MRTKMGVVAAAVAVVGLAVGCSDNGGGSKSTATTRPEDRRVTDAEVTTGLGQLQTQVDQAATSAGTDAAAAKTQADTAFETWERIEGTIKNNEQDLYLRYEDALSDVRTGTRDGDAAKAQRGAQDIQAISAEYLANHP
jgi:hypothetical protein